MHRVRGATMKGVWISKYRLVTEVAAFNGTVVGTEVLHKSVG
jgi:hypothetical protein